MKKEYIGAFIIGLLVLAYILDAVVYPLSLKLTTPYQFFTVPILTKYAFSATSIILKSTALIIATLWIISLIHLNALAKGLALLIFAGLLQLYALQDIVTRSYVVPQEWSLSFTLTGMILILVAVLFLVAGSIYKVYKSLQDESHEETIESEKT